MLAVREYGVLSGIDAAFWAYRRHFGVLLLIGAALNAVTISVSVATLLLGPNPELVEGSPSAMLDYYLEMGPWWLVAAFVNLIVAAFGTALVTSLAVEVILERPVHLGVLVGRAMSKIWTVAGATLISGLVAGIGFVFLIVPGIYISLGFAFLGPVIVHENLSATDALGRSWRLARGHRWRILGALVLLYLPITIVAAALEVVFQGVLEITDPVVRQVAQMLAGAVLGAVISPLVYLALALYYFSARVHHESYDIQLLSRRAESAE